MDRKALLEANLAWAAAIARNVHRKLPPSFDIDDLIQTAHVALWRFIEEKYDPALNDNVQGASYQTVRGAVLMSVRRRAFKEATHEPLDSGRSHGSRSNEVDGAGSGLRAFAVDPSPNPEEQLREEEDGSDSRIRVLALLRLIKALPVEQMYLVRRVFLDDVAVETLAHTWGVPRKTIARQLGLAVRRLRISATEASPAKRGCGGGWLFVGSPRVRDL